MAILRDMLLPFLLLLVLDQCVGVNFDPCEKNLGLKFVTHPGNCKKYFVCMNHKAFPLQCATDKMWDPEQHRCINMTEACRGEKTSPDLEITSSYDSPYMYEPLPSVSTRPVCAPGSKRKYAHPTNCAQYYDCGSNTAEDWWGKRLRECAYPYLFHERKQACAHYKHVHCGRKFEPKDPCEYVANQCRTINCQPCEMRFGSCRGNPNGLHKWVNREWTPYYLACKDERVVFESRCLSPSPGFIFVFDPTINTCLLPKEPFKYPVLGF